MHQGLRITSLFTALPLIASMNLGHAQCHYIPASTTSTDTVTFLSAAAVMGSFGCSLIDPTYWLSGNTTGVAALFVQPADHPSIRIWGMNDDDTVSVSVNATPYFLDAASATLSPKVVCGLSPGPDGMAFSGGRLVGVNSNADGNYSYQDVTLNVDNVNSVTVHSLAGAGWGFAGVSINCATAIAQTGSTPLALFPNPVHDRLVLPAMPGQREMMITDATGALVKHVHDAPASVDVSDLAPGCYVVTLSQGDRRSVGRVVKW